MISVNKEDTKANKSSDHGKQTDTDSVSRTPFRGRRILFFEKLREIDQMRAAGQDIISLGVGGPDQPPHPKVIARLAAESAKPGTHAYQPYKGTAILREAFAGGTTAFTA